MTHSYHIYRFTREMAAYKIKKANEGGGEDDAAASGEEEGGADEVEE